MSISVTDLGTESTASAAASRNRRPRPDDADILPHLRLIELAFPEKIEGGDRPFMTGEG